MRSEKEIVYDEKMETLKDDEYKQKNLWHIFNEIVQRNVEEICYSQSYTLHYLLTKKYCTIAIPTTRALTSPLFLSV